MSHSQPGPAARRTGPEGDRKAGGRPNSLGLTNKQLDAAMVRVGGSGAGKSDRRRKFVRWSFRNASLDLHIIQPGGSANTCRVACRNISCGGLSVLHSAFIYPGSPCIAHLPRTGGGTNAVPGVIVRCVHVMGMIHEIGIRFNSNIAAGEYVDNDPMAGQYSLELVEPESLTGTLLCVEDSGLDQKLIQHYLRGTNIRIRMAENAQQAAEAARDGCDIVLCDYHVGDRSGEEVVAAVRDALPTVPVIVVTADSSPATMERIRKMPVDAFLAKPFTDSMLQRALGEFLIARSDRAANAPSIGGKVAADLQAELAKDLAEFQRKLEVSITENDATACYVLCQQLGATAHSLNLNAMAKMAQDASSSLAKTMSIPQSEKQVRELIAACGKRAAA